MASIGDLIIGGHTPIVSQTFEVSHQLAKTGPGQVYDLTAHNYNASVRMVLLLDQIAAPVNGAVTPIFAWPIAGSTAGGPGTFSLAYLVPPLRFLNGLWVILSTVMTTPFTLTTAGATDAYYVGLIGIQ